MLRADAKAAKASPKHDRLVIAAGLLTAGMMLASPAVASSIVWNPKATNDGSVTLGSTPGPFSSSGGTGGVYSNLDVASGSGSSSFSGDMVVDITSFNTLNNAPSGVNHTWQLFAVIDVQGTGSWSPHQGGSTFTISSMSANYDVFGVQGGSTASFSDPTSFNTTNLTNFASFGISGITGSSCDTTGASSSAKCLLLGTGVGQLGSSLSVIDTGYDYESFGLDTSFTPASWALGAGPSGGIFDGSAPLGINLTVNSGNGDQANNISVEQIGGPDEFITASCNGTGNSGCTAGPDSVNWGADPVPEPASLSLFGAAILGMVWRRRRAT